MTRREMTDAERIAGLREAIRAANGDWHEATALWSVCSDLDWLLSRAAAPVPVREAEGETALRAALQDILDGQATDEEIQTYRLDADDPINRQLNWYEWTIYALRTALETTVDGSEQSPPGTLGTEMPVKVRPVAATPAPVREAEGIDVAWAEAEAAFIAAQGDDDGFGVEIAYWDEFPEQPWAVTSNDIQVEAATLPAALQALAAKIRAALRDAPPEEREP